MNQHPASPIPIVPCPVCGADPGARSWFKTPHSAYGAGSVSLEIGNNAFFLDTINASPLVCTHCGYVQFFISVEELQAKLTQYEAKQKRTT